MWERKFEVDMFTIICAIRYALPRMTFAPSIIIENIKENIDKFDADEILSIIKEIEDHNKTFGWDGKCDENTWLGFLSYLKDKYPCG